MSIKKPTPLIEGRPQRICPICGLRSYSRWGIHPQCAVRQADEPRQRRVKEENSRKAAKDKDKQRTKPPIKTWKKLCPVCHTELHQRNQFCRCGHRFYISYTRK